MGRRATGTVEALSSAIRLKFTVHGVRHAETLDLKPTAPNLKASHRILAQVLAAIQAGVYRREDFFAGAGKPTATQTFAEYADEWLKTLTLEKSTRRSYKTALEATWKPALGDKLLVVIRFSDIRKAIADRASDVSGKTINNHLIVLRSVFSTAIADGLLREDPTEKIKNLKHQAAGPDPFTADEKESVLTRLREHSDDRVWNYYDFAFHTGLRPSEEIALKWSDIDWGRKKAMISRAQVDYEEKGTKTHRVREIDLSRRALAVLARQRQHTFMKATGYVFENPNTGRPWAGVQAQLRCFWNPALRALGLRHRDAYQTRHTFATLLLMGGVNPTYISRQLGHANTGMLFKVYGRWIEGADKGAEAAKADALMEHTGGSTNDELSRNRPRQDM